MPNDSKKPTAVELQVLNGLTSPEDSTAFTDEDFEIIDQHIQGEVNNAYALNYEQTLKTIAAITAIASGGGLFLVGLKAAAVVGAAGAATASGVYWQHQKTETDSKEIEMQPIGSPTTPQPK